MRVDMEDEEDWVALAPLATLRYDTRRGVWSGRFTFQVTCFSRFAEDRTDKKADAPWSVAAQVKAILDQADICVKNYGDGTAVQGALAIGVGEAEYLDGRKLGLGRAGDQFGPINVHAVALTFTGILGAS